jgi:hypothetical protein
MQEQPNTGRQPKNKMFTSSKGVKLCSGVEPGGQWVHAPLCALFPHVNIIILGHEIIFMNIPIRGKRGSCSFI